MKRWTLIYENLKLPIRITYFGFVMIAIGSLILNENVNIFYTFTSPFILSLANLLLQIGQTVIKALPLFFLSNLVAKKANSGVPITMAVIGYLTFLVVTMLFSTNSTMSNLAYANNIGISFSSGNVTYYPLHTGLLGAFLVAFVTRYSYIRSRNRSNSSFLGFVNKDTAAIIYNILLCGLLGFLVTLVYPFCYAIVQDVIVYVARDLSDPIRIGIYGVADRVMSIFGLGDMIREPFWYSGQGGSYITLSGQNVVGDVNIWRFMQEANATYAGCGRFITPYYAINFFVIPAIYLGMFFSISDKKEKKRSILFFVLAIVISVLYGNPLPLELLLLFTSPLLLCFYLFVVLVLFYIFSSLNIFLGFIYSGSTIVAMPGSFPDYIIQLRDPILFDSVLGIFIVGVIAFVICFIATKLYYGKFAYNLLNTNKVNDLIENLSLSVGGLDNITQATCGLFRVKLELANLEAVSFAKLSKLGASRITEIKEGLMIEFGSSSPVIAKALNKEIQRFKREIDN